MANIIYNNAKSALNAYPWTSDTWKILLTTSSYTPDIDAHVYVSDVTNELVGTGYVRKTLAGQAVSIDTGNDRADFKANNVTWTAIQADTAAKAIVYRFVTVDGDSPIIACLDITPATITNGGDFTLEWDGQLVNGRLFSIG